jgi:hypothetical protein
MPRVRTHRNGDPERGISGISSSPSARRSVIVARE